MFGKKKIGIVSNLRFISMKNFMKKVLLPRGQVLSCLALRSSFWGRGSWLFCFSLVGSLCTVCHGLFDLPLGIISWL